MGSFWVEIKSFDHWNPHPEAKVQDQINEYEANIARQGGRIVLEQTNRYNAVFSDPDFHLGADLPPPLGNHGMSLETIFRTFRAAQIPVVAELPNAGQEQCQLVAYPENLQQAA